ncbi:transmembrane protein 256 homolog isoform X2 [Caloenas nicobarica]|uniref:transmembrane protein 256 homolog isoform X2 n=1 Tax=Caloenas nicobarica TaxID=187106 RepID=UPI0032B7F385
MAAARAWARVGALSGAAAVGAAAFGAHGLRRSDRDEYQKELYETANRFHLLHSLALLAVPHSGRPRPGRVSALRRHRALLRPPLLPRADRGPGAEPRGPARGTLFILGWAAMAL